MAYIASPYAEVIGRQRESILAIFTAISRCLGCHAIAPIAAVIGRGRSSVVSILVQLEVVNRYTWFRLIAGVYLR